MSTQTRQRGEMFAGYTDLTTLACPECGIVYAIPEKMRASAQKRGNWELMWCCPNGHQVGFGDRTEDKLRKQLERANDRAGRLAAERDQANASARAQRGAATRARNERDRIARRVKAGVCPCCNRTFKQLRRHMASQHPGFDPAADE